MKKIAAIILTLTLLLTLTLTAAASSVSVATELTNIRSYYSQKNQATRYEETLALAAMGMLEGRTPFLPEKDGTAGTLAKRILAVNATGKIPENDTDAEELKNLQNTDGAFGNVESHCLSMMALSSRKAVYGSAKAYAWLLAQQGENGSFSDSAKDTALAVCILSRSQNDAELEAAAKGVKYLNQYEASNAVDLCWQIIGITDGGVDANTAADRGLLEDLLSYQNTADYSFYRSHNDTETDGEATVMALIALDTINKDGSLFQRLTTEGTLEYYNLADALPLIIFAAVLLVLSIAFWIFIFLHKKNTKTLDETKSY